MNTWTVWVGGSEMDSYLVSLEKAEFIAESWSRLGYDDVVIEQVNND